MANEVQNHLTVVPPEPGDLAKALELEMCGRRVPHEPGNLFVEVVDGAFEYVTKWEPKINALRELSKKYKDHTFLLGHRCWEIQRNGQVVICNGDVLASFDRSGGYGLFDDLLHPAIDLFAPYLRERTLVQCAEDRLQDAIGIVRDLIRIMDDERFRHSPSTPYSDCRDQKQTEKVRADLAALLESMATQIGQLNFRGVLLEETELREGLIRNAKLAEDLMTTLGLDYLVPDQESAVRFAILPFSAVVNKDPYLVIAPALHYVNADRSSGRYTKDAGGSFPPIEWEVCYVGLWPSEVRQIRRLPDDDQNPFDIDITMKATDRGIGREVWRSSNKARWKANPEVVQEAEQKAVEMSKALAAKAAGRAGIAIFDNFEAIEPVETPTKFERKLVL